MLLLVLDRDPYSAGVLAALLSRNGHLVQRALDAREPPDAMIVGLPAPVGLAPETALEIPLLLLVEGRLAVGELEAWIEGRTHWALLSKPIRENALELTLARIVRPAAAELQIPLATPRLRG